MQDASLQESFKVSEWMRRLSLPSVFRACAVRLPSKRLE